MSLCVCFSRAQDTLTDSSRNPESGEGAPKATSASPPLSSAKGERADAEGERAKREGRKGKGRGNMSSDSFLDRLIDLVLSLIRPCDGGDADGNLSRQQSGRKKQQPEVAPEPPPPPPPEKNEVFKGISDGAIWNCSLGKHRHGEFSFAVIQANTQMEDFGAVECTNSGTFVGVFDGHGGDAAATWLSENMYQIVREVADEWGGLSTDVLTRAFEEADKRLLQVVRDNWKIQPNYATAGSCALVGVLQGSTLYMSSVGDSRAVLATSNLAEAVDGSESRSLRPVEITVEHSAASEDCRNEVLERVPDDPTILKEKNGQWRVKGFIQVTRSLGDFYLKYQEFQCPPLYTKFRLAEELKSPALICTPSVITLPLTVHDKFVIFATDGLWDYVSNQEAVDIVQRFPRPGIARRLVKLAVIRAAKRRNLGYKNVQQMRPGRRREVHDDTSVVILFLDHVGTPRERELASLSVRSSQQLQEAPKPSEGEFLPADDLPVEEDVEDDFEFIPDKSQ